MRRLAILAIVTLAIAACSETTAPTRKAPGARSADWTCRSGYTSSDGHYVCTDSAQT